MWKLLKDSGENFGKIGRMQMRLLPLVILVSLMAQQGLAQKMIPVLESTQEASLGDPIEIRADGLDAGVKCLWDAGEYKAQIRLYDNKRVLAFWPKRAGSYRIVLFVASDEPELRVYRVVVTGSFPDVDPDLPDNPPKPPPKPQFPDQTLGLSSLVYAAAVGIKDASVIGPRLALNHRGLAAKLRAVASFSTPDAIKELKKLNTETFKTSGHAEQWTNLLRVDVGKALAAASQAGKLDKKADVADALLELAAGFEALGGPK